MVYCPNCGIEVGNSKFCPECGTTQGFVAGNAQQPVYIQKKKENYNPFIGAGLCCFLSPIVTLIYYLVTEPEEDSLARTFKYVLIPIGVLIGTTILFLLTMAMRIYDTFEGLIPPPYFVGPLMIIVGTPVVSLLIFNNLNKKDKN